MHGEKFNKGGGKIIKSSRKSGETKMGEYVTIKLPRELFYLIDESALKAYGYSSRTEFIKDSIRKMLEAHPDFKKKTASSKK
jgi:metal-responsive CopG/Arc/MetJ family transcriptional regulator